MDRGYIYHIRSPSSFHYAFPHHWYAFLERPILCPVHFLKCILIGQGVFTLVFPTCINCFNQVKSSFTYSVSITLFLYYSTAYSALCYIIFIYT
jgi:hypothetical protein